MSADVANGALRRQVDSRGCEAQTARKAADANSANLNFCTNEPVEFHSQQIASDVSVQKLTAELKEVTFQLVTVTAEKLELSTELNDVKVEH